MNKDAALIIEAYRQHYDEFVVRSVPRTDAMSRLLRLIGIHRTKLVADGSYGNGLIAFTDMALDGYD